MNVRKIISGGQTGADRAALDFALAKGFEIGGFVPHGRVAEDGKIPDRYTNLTETPSSDPAERTELNIVNSDATLIISNSELAGGSRLTASLVEFHKKSLLHIDLSIVQAEKAADAVRDWIGTNEFEVINVAGPRASEDPEIYHAVVDLLERAFA